MVELVKAKLREIAAKHGSRRLSGEQLATLENLQEVDFESIRLVDYVLSVEREFGFELSDDLDIDVIQDLSKLANYIIENGELGFLEDCSDR